MEPGIRKELLIQLEQLGSEEQRQVLDFVRALSSNKQSGQPRARLIEFAGAICAEDLVTMSAAIEAGCEQVSPDEW